MKVRSVGVRRVWDSETPSLLSYTLRYVSFAEVGSVCRVALREPMHLCTCVSEEGGEGEALCPETPSLLSYTQLTLRYVSFAEIGCMGLVALREPMHLCTCVSEEIFFFWDRVFIMNR